MYIDFTVVHREGEGRIADSLLQGRCCEQFIGERAHSDLGSGTVYMDMLGISSLRSEHSVA